MVGTNSSITQAVKHSYPALNRLLIQYANTTEGRMLIEHATLQQLEAANKILSEAVITVNQSIPNGIKQVFVNNVDITHSLQSLESIPSQLDDAKKAGQFNSSHHVENLYYKLGREHGIMTKKAIQADPTFTEDSTPDGGLKSGAIVTIIVASLFLLLVAYAVYYCVRQNNEKKSATFETGVKDIK